jgi:predicted DNA-binding protein
VTLDDVVALTITLLQFCYHGVMIRTQIQLTEEQAEAVKRLAQREGRSVADVMRESLDVHLRSRGVIDREAQKRRALEAIGRYRSGVRDLATAHDRHAAEAFAE